MKAIQIETIDPATLIITRDNQLDDEYYDAIYAEKRREALHMAGREALQHLRDLPQIAVNIGWTIAEHMAETARR